VMVPFGSGCVAHLNSELDGHSRSTIHVHPFLSRATLIF